MLTSSVAGLCWSLPFNLSRNLGVQVLNVKCKVQAKGHGYDFEYRSHRYSVFGYFGPNARVPNSPNAGPTCRFRVQGSFLVLLAAPGLGYLEVQGSYKEAIAVLMTQMPAGQLYFKGL